MLFSRRKVDLHRLRLAHCRREHEKRQEQERDVHERRHIDPDPDAPRFLVLLAFALAFSCLSYVSTNPAKDGKYRKIKVNVMADVDGNGKPDKLKIHHKEGYFAEQ